MKWVLCNKEKQWNNEQYLLQVEIKDEEKKQKEHEELNWKLTNEILMEPNISNGIIETGDTKEDNIVWGKDYQIRVRACFLKISYTEFSMPIELYVTKSFLDSHIIKYEEVKVLLSFLPKTKESIVKLLYRGSENEFSAQKFHQLCNRKGPTITIVLSEQLNIFGGYTNLDWYSRKTRSISDYGTFLYLLKSSSGIPSQRFFIKEESSYFATYNKSSQGPTFGKLYKKST